MLEPDGWEEWANSEQVVRNTERVTAWGIAEIKKQLKRIEENKNEHLGGSGSNIRDGFINGRNFLLPDDQQGQEE